jgi:hypothetical protein
MAEPMNNWMYKIDCHQGQSALRKMLAVRVKLHGSRTGG